MDVRSENYFALERLLDESVRIHGHLCPGQVLGVRMSMLGLKNAGIEDPKGKDRKNLIVIVELDRCATDAVQSVTGCSLGHRTMKFMDYGKMAATFVNLSTGKALGQIHGMRKERIRPEESQRLVGQLQGAAPDPILREEHPARSAQIAHRPGLVAYCLDWHFTALGRIRMLHRKREGDAHAAVRASLPLPDQLVTGLELSVEVDRRIQSPVAIPAYECPRKWRSAHADRQDVSDADVTNRLAVAGAVYRGVRSHDVVPATEIGYAAGRPAFQVSSGELLAGKYRVIDEIGRGGMGVVVRAEDTRLKRTVALKFLSPELTSDPEARERFIQEARAASALEHPNICNIHEIDEAPDGRLFMAMACYEGESLRDRLNREKPHPGNRTVDNIKTAKEQQQQVKDLMGKAREYFKPIAAIPDTPKVDSQEFTAALRRTIDQLQKQATNSSVILPPNYSFSFEAQKPNVTFAPGSLEPLSQQLGEVKVLSEILFNAKVNSLDNIRRVRVSADDSSGPVTDYIEKRPVTNELAVLVPYELTFRCFSQELADTLAGLASSPQWNHGEAAARRGALVLHYSTYYVFDGARTTPYSEEDPARPLNVYGASKLEGERALAASACRHLILRTCWVYESQGHNFLLTILKLAHERDELRVVGDQIGSPTAARDLAAASAQLLAMREPPNGLHHLTAGGQCSWFEFAREILALSGRSRVRLTQITSAEYPTAARRPRYSVLSCERIRRACGIALPLWRESLARVLADVKSAPLRSQGNRE